MDRTRVPVELPDPTRAAWKRHLDDLAGLDVASARFRADLEELHPADHKPGTGFPAQVSRFVRGNGEEILSWLKPDNAHGDALCDALDTTREALWAWLQDRLSPPATGAALRADDLALLPRRATGPDLSSAESRERLLSDGSMSSQGVTRLSLGQHLFGPPLPTRTDRLDAWSALLTALAQESRRPVVVIGGAEVGPFAPVDPDPAAAPPGPSLEVELRLLPEGPEDVDGWLTRLVERARLRPEQADRARATLVDPWRRSPDLLPREVASCADLARLVDDAANDRLGPLTPRSLRERIARWRRDDALRCATSEATRAWLESAEDLLLEHLIATGAFEAPRPAAAVAHALRPEADGRRITDVDAVLRALRSSEEVRLQAAADLARANHRELLDQLRRDGLLEDAPDQSEPHLRLGPVLVGLARAACPLRLTAAQAARLAVHPEGQALIREAVLCATDLAAWVDVALTADLPHNPHLAAAVARGLAGHPDLAPGLLERLWASLVWMVLHGMGTFEGGGWRNPYGALLEELSKAWRDRLPLLAGPNPYGALRARVPPEVRACVARWRPEPPDAPWPAPPAELWSQRTRHWAGPWEAAAELCHLAPFQVSPSFHLSWGSHRFDDTPAAITLHHAHRGDPAAQRLLLRLEPAEPIWTHTDVELPTLLRWWVEQPDASEDDLQHDLARLILRHQRSAGHDAIADIEAAASIVERRPSLLPDLLLLGAAGLRARWDEDWEGQQIAPEDPIPGTWAISPRGRLEGLAPAHIVTLAARLKRAAVLHELAHPSDRCAQAAARLDADRERLEHEAFPNLHRIAEVRHRALLALAEAGDREPLRASLAAAWTVHHPKLLWNRRVRALLRWCADRPRRGSDRELSDAEWAAALHTILGVPVDRPEELQSAVDLHIEMSLPQRPPRPADTLPDLHAPRTGDLLALLDPSPRHRWLRLAPWVSCLWAARSTPTLRPFLDACAPSGRWSDAWSEPPAWVAERERWLVLRGDAPTLQAWSERQAETHFHNARLHLPRDLPLAAAVWEELRPELRTQILHQLPAGPVDPAWWRRARAVLSIHERYHFARRHALTAEARQAAQRWLEETEDPHQKLRLWVGLPEIPLDAMAVPLIGAALGALAWELDKLVQRADEGWAAALGREGFDTLLDAARPALLQAWAAPEHGRPGSFHLSHILVALQPHLGAQAWRDLLAAVADTPALARAADIAIDRAPPARSRRSLQEAIALVDGEADHLSVRLDHALRELAPAHAAALLEHTLRALEARPSADWAALLPYVMRHAPTLLRRLIAVGDRAEPPREVEAMLLDWAQADVIGGAGLRTWLIERLRPGALRHQQA